MEIRTPLEETPAPSPTWESPTLTSPTLVGSSPSTPSLTPSPVTPPPAPLYPVMPPPPPFFSGHYRHSRNGSSNSSSSRDRLPQLPSPVDSQSSGSRRSHGAEIPSATPSQTSPTRSRGSSLSVVLPNVLENESLEFPPRFTSTHSILYPNLHFLLARDSVELNRFFLDMWTDPQLSPWRRILDSFGTLWISNRQVEHVRIISRDFPWVIDIKLDDAFEGEQHGITCNDIWNEIHKELMEPIQDTDWAYLSDMAAREPTARRRHEHLVSLVRQRNNLGEAVPLLRLDWLMRKTVFAGLEKDEGYRLATQRLLPGRDQCPETWIAHFVETD